MRFFELLNFQHVMGYILVGWLFMVVFGVGLAFSHFRGKEADQRMQTITGRYADGIEERDAPYPLVMILIIAGTVVWGFLYILMHGLLGVKI